ncbi:MAG: HD domain-containing protein [Chitinophagales bacterium]
MIDKVVNIGVQQSDIKKYELIYKTAEPYMRVRKNDVHIPLSFHYALRLLKEYPNADKDIVSAAIILHDTGWYSIDEEEIFSKGFGPNMMESDVRFLHEKEGVRLSAEVLSKLNYSNEFIQKVGEIIDGHDTRKFAQSLEDEIVRDADKLWRFSVTGVSVACDWFKYTPTEYIAHLEQNSYTQLHLEASKRMAKEDLENTRQMLMCHVI